MIASGLAAGGSTWVGATDYDPGQIEPVSADAMAAGFSQMSGEDLPLIGLPTWWLVMAQGFHANSCLDAALTLEAAYQVLGIRAVPVFVEVWTARVDTGERYHRASSAPRLEGTTLAGGHVGVWLPDHHRFVDPTVQQFPEVRRESVSPFVGRLPGSWEELAQQRTVLAYLRGKTLVTYWPLPIEQTAHITEAYRQLVRELDPPEGHHRSGVNLATEFLDFLRSTDNLPIRIATSSHGRIHQLLGTLKGARIEKEGKALRIYLASHSGGLLLDEIP